jgi:hypothetical protein
MGVPEELAGRALARFSSSARRLSWVAEEFLHSCAERLEVVRIVHKEPLLAMLDLVDDPSDCTRHDRPGLPHRLGDRQAEALGEALLRDDGSVPLERVHDRRSLVLLRRPATLRA